MENMENNMLPPEMEHTPEIPQPPVENRRRSPYENSPYIMADRPAQAQYQPAPQPPAEQKPRKRKGRGFLKFVGFVCAMALVGAGAYALCRWQTNQIVGAMQDQIYDLQAQIDTHEHTNKSATTSTASGDLTPGQVYGRNEQSVVLISTDISTGSGFVLTEDGFVVTNYHVVEDAGYISVVLFDGSSYDAALKGFDAANDVAVLKMEGSGFRPVKLGSSDDLVVGDQVVAIGNPLGELTSTLTVGFVSAKERDVSTDDSTINMMQTDCAINSGNSGGPLFNMQGEVVGITTAKYSGTSVSGASIEGIGFAIPMDDVAGIIEDLMEFGYARGAYLGVTVYNVDPETARMYGMPLGALVNTVDPGSCAEAAGIKPSDIITGLGSYKVDSYTDLSRALRKYDAGETTTITVYRAGQEQVLSITLDERPQANTQSSPEPTPGGEEFEMPENGSYEEWFRYFFGGMD